MLLELSSGKTFVATSVVFDETKIVFKNPDLLARLRGVPDEIGPAMDPGSGDVTGRLWDIALGGAPLVDARGDNLHRTYLTCRLDLSGMFLDLTPPGAGPPGSLAVLSPDSGRSHFAAS